MTSNNNELSWVPMEANAEVFNEWSHNLGLAECDSFNEIFGLDDDLLDFVPKPVKSVLLLFPTTEAYENYRKKQYEDILKTGQPELDSTLIHFPQKIGNACGTIALLHALANSSVTLDPTSDLAKLFEKASSQSPDERAQSVIDAKFLRTAHQSSAEAGQSQAPSADDDVNLHFVAFVQAPAEISDNIRLIELDGRKHAPIDHGPSTDLLKDTANVVREKFIKLNPDNINFALIALSSSVQD